MKAQWTHVKRYYKRTESWKAALFNCLVYNCSNSANNVSVSDSVFRFNRQFANEKQYLIFVWHECDNTALISNRSWTTSFDQKRFLLFRKRLIISYQKERRSDSRSITLILRVCNASSSKSDRLWSELHHKCRRHNNSRKISL